LILISATMWTTRLLALAVGSPELQVLGVMTTFGDTETRAKITDRFLARWGGRIRCWREGDGDEESDVAAAYAENHLAKIARGRGGVLLEEIRKYPGKLR
jgi:hypothetical protein